MKVKKFIKTIVALSTGLTMIGATVFGAAAAGLGDYPSQYINDGTFNGMFVVGSNAKTEDVLGIVDIATSIQFSSKKDIVVSQGTGKTVTSLSGDVYEFGTNSNSLEINEYLGDVKSTVDDDDFDLLADSKMRTRKGSTEVKQTLKFSSDSGLQIVYDEQDDVVAQYLQCKDKENLFTYELRFTDGLESDIYESSTGNSKSNDGKGYLNDISNENVFMLGHTYTITEGYVTDCATNDVTLTFMTGSTEATMKEHESQTITLEGVEYQVNVMIISDRGNEISVKFMVNSEVTNQMFEGDTYTFDDGLMLGVKDILANEGSEVNGEDLVSFYLGANKIEFDNGKVEIGEERIEDATVEISCSRTGDDEVRISSIKYTLRADSRRSGDLIIKEGDTLRGELDEPEGMLGINWDITYLGMDTEDTYDVTIDADGEDRYEFTFLTQDDVEYTIPLVYVEASGTPHLMFGEDNESRLVTSDTEITEDDYFILTDEVDDVDGVTHVLQLEEIDADEKTIHFVDLSTNEEIELQYENDDTIRVGGDDYTVTDITNSNVKVSDATNVIRLKGGHKVVIDSVNQLTFTTPGSLTDNGELQTFNIDLSVYGNNVDLDVTGIDMVSDDSDYKKGITGYGIKLEQNTDDEDELMITIPEGQVFPIVALIGETYSFDSTTTVEGEIIVPEYSRIDVGVAVLDSEITSISADNLIVVGGPCANTVAATLMSIPNSAPGCYEQFPLNEGEGLIRMSMNGEKVATLVAGYTAKDTRDAAKILAKYDDYATDFKDKTELIISNGIIKSTVVVPVDTNTTGNVTG